MKKGLTELVFVIDKSGSMAGLEKDTIGGFNSMLEKQKQTEGECVITTVFFDNCCELLHDRLDIRGVEPLTEKEYATGGSTALLDAIGSAINKTDSAKRHTSEEYRAEKAAFVIITDGEENSSRSYGSSEIKALIERKKEEDGWEFIFLGANIDAVETAVKFGIAPSRAQNFCADSEGIRLNYTAAGDAIASFRMSSAIPENWNESIEKDFSSRSKKKTRR